MLCSVDRRGRTGYAELMRTSPLGPSSESPAIGPVGAETDSKNVEYLVPLLEENDMWLLNTFQWDGQQTETYFGGDEGYERRYGYFAASKGLLKKRTKIHSPEEMFIPQQGDDWITHLLHLFYLYHRGRHQAGRRRLHRNWTRTS